MIFQGVPYSCGAAAVVNACRALGDRKITEAEVMINGGTVEQHGTQHEGLLQALVRAKRGYQLLSELSFAKAEEALGVHLATGQPAILLTENGDHWETAIGMLGDAFIIVDPQNTKANLRQNGVHVVPPGRQFRRYWTADKETKKRFAILVTQ